MLPYMYPVSAEKNLSNKYFMWKGELKLLSTGQYITYWKVTHKLVIIKYTESDNKIEVDARCETNFSQVAFYGDRVKDHIVDVIRTVNSTTPIIYLYNETWGFYMSFLFSPFMIINPRSGHIEDELKSLFIEGYILGSKRNKYVGYFGGLFFKTWNVQLGTYRDVYYMETYYQAAILNRGEPNDPKTGISNSSVMEINVRIDRELGIVLGLRFFWYYRQNYHEIKIEITDTNAFPKGQFYLTLFGIIAIVMVAILAVRYWQVRRRRRLIRV